MKTNLSRVWALGLFMLMMMLGSSAFAQASRTWVSGVGDDANPCSRTAPCKTFAGAISKTAAGGEIDVMDDGGYGAVTITKAITIDGSGHQAGILVSGTGINGIVISAGTDDVVILRGLTFTGVGGPGNYPLNAVRYLSARYVAVEDSTIHGFLNGINMATTVVNGRMDVRHVKITNATTTTNTFGIHIGPSGSITTLSNVAVRGFSYGLTTRGGETYMRGSDLVANDIGYQNLGGTLLSFGDNMVNGNNSTSPPTGLITHF